MENTQDAQVQDVASSLDGLSLQGSALSGKLQSGENAVIEVLKQAIKEGQDTAQEATEEGDDTQVEATLEALTEMISHRKKVCKVKPMEDLSCMEEGSAKSRAISINLAERIRRPPDRVLGGLISFLLSLLTEFHRVCESVKGLPNDQRSRIKREHDILNYVRFFLSAVPQLSPVGILQLMLSDGILDEEEEGLFVMPCAFFPSVNLVRVTRNPEGWKDPSACLSSLISDSTQPVPGKTAWRTGGQPMQFPESKGPQDIGYTKIYEKVIPDYLQEDMKPAESTPPKPLQFTKHHDWENIPMTVSVVWYAVDYNKYKHVLDSLTSKTGVIFAEGISGGTLAYFSDLTSILACQGSKFLGHYLMTCSS